MFENNNRKLLISVLQMAYSGELAAGLAYRGHWHSVMDQKERQEIQKIENEEWHHRKLVGEILADLQAKSIRYREIRAGIIGSVIAMFCHVGGWLAPMFGAGRLESKNIREYETAARYARDCGRADLIDCLLTMAEVEWEHERYFRSKVLGHRWAEWLPLWPEPPKKESIRSTFNKETTVIEVSPLASTSAFENPGLPTN
jgi:rubrerythrin